MMSSSRTPSSTEKLATQLKVVELQGRNVISCSKCRTQVTMDEEIISREFTGHFGRSYLFNFAVNVSLAKSVDRTLRTGRHTVCDVHCIGCDNYLGWKYERTPNESESYKLGKFVLEKRQLYQEQEY